MAKEILGSKVEYLDMDVHDISPENIGRFDIVLFLGVLYHLKYPLMALEKIAEVTKELIIVESEYFRSLIKLALLRYAEGDSYNQDPTNQFIPNTACIKGMLKDVGFRKIEVIYRTPFNWKELIRAVLNLNLYTRGRIILKAYK